MAQRAQFDMDEVAPGRFVINNMQLPGLLKGEGTLVGRIFELTTWRRDGLFARLRMRHFRVRTLADAIGALPELPDPPAIGGALSITAANDERTSRFEPQRLDWVLIEPEPGGRLGLHVGWVLRRRRHRGPASYAVVRAESGIVPLGQSHALLLGYAQAAVHHPRLVATRQEEAWVIPALELPAPHMDVLQRIGTPSATGVTVDQRGWPLAQELFACLGIRLTDG